MLLTPNTDADPVAHLKERAQARLAQVLPELLALSDDLWAHPELAFEEHHAAQAITALLEQQGMRVQRETGGLATAFSAEWPQRQPGPRVGILAEYDALPELGHACGHNLIATCAVGAFLALQAVADELGGSATLIGCPAEEDGGGKIYLLEADAFDGLDAAMMAHPMPEFLGANVDARSLACAGLELRFHGKPAHSAGAPQDGINAVDAMINTYVAVNGLRQRLPRDINISCIITHGGSAVNVIPELAVVKYLVRGERWQHVEQVIGRIIGVAEGCSEAIGATVEGIVGERQPAPEFQYYTEDRPNTTLQEVFEANLRRIGHDPHRKALEGGMGSTDFANVSQYIPGVHLNLALPGATEPPHTQQFAAAAGGEGGRTFIREAAAAMAFSAIDVLAAPGVLDALRAEHAASLAASPAPVI